MTEPIISSDQRDALSVLAYLYLRFGHFHNAAKLLLALDQLDPGSVWARHARCLALLRAGNCQEAAAEAGRLLVPALDNDDRFLILQVRVKAFWKLGLKSEARACQRLVATLLKQAALQGASRGRAV
ncbi:hypothetical protein EOA60_25790 [Mesorhizobium sp. M1A.F.Ca.IN.020.06.1.1]|uniref:type III secretion apparatus assembly chaperone SctY n=1 Tax=unclassified Mesorhizobium TaxID=325217 RepID=UPI000FCBC5B7|nr:MULTISPECIES: hypothetical protein [unclassified Mesorhizobium]RUV82107.1 hypothetical protein EOA51_29520 [Mesorhizobium sp. M1A.F.Ca.IN.020.32.1.1]RUW05706.1 hypothetical protein EOA46_27850 [Mesorhizobium sp. M1A.F.Ca.IN.022.05.2.1]RUW20438.1 hypothetical protein EOA60_25790 [Mesorhizobium sp. M1A.F.Ca.IN.020.06.1.1]RWF82306.1 MAG: hypothetical protein EOQ35_10650 [Mesorhizobium sp.]RWG04305.1 MAG: hypothetical protein EOQ38_06415 [Mesorhizobium sp.]